MTFPQPSSINPVLSGQQSFRLYTPLASAGDLYESEVSALAFSLGPNSDLANVRVRYFDSNADGMVNEAVISPDRALVGRVDARNDAIYPGSGGRKGRILISPDDLFDPNYTPPYVFRGGVAPGAAFDPLLDAIAFETPYLDVIQYFVNPPSVQPQRSDRTFRYQYFPVAPDPANGGVTMFAVPMYGRKSGYITWSNSGGVNTFFGIQLVRLSSSSSPGPDSSTFGSLINTALIDFDSGGNAIYAASQDGLWDLMLLSLGGDDGVVPLGSGGYYGAAFAVTVTLSDDPQ